MRTGIIKTVKTARYVQIHNEAIQKKLKRLESIGVLTYLLSLPETWVIQKMDLYNRFGRAPVSHAFNELQAAGFLVSMKFRNGQRNVWGYAISDIEFDIDQIVEMIIETDLPCLEVKSRFEFELIENELEDKMSKNVDKSTVSQLSNFNTSGSTIENEKLNVNSSESPAIKETKNKEISNKEINTKNTTTSSSSSHSELKRTTEAKEKIDLELREKFNGLPFDQIKEDLINDESVVTRTAKQYRAMLEYRLKNYKPKSSGSNNFKQQGRTEVLPDWWDKENVKTPEPTQEEIEDLEVRKRQVLEKLGLLAD